MTRETCRAIIAERFRSWGALLEAEIATPMVLVAIEHGPHLGRIRVVVPVDFDGDNDSVILLLEAAALELRARR